MIIKKLQKKTTWKPKEIICSCGSKKRIESITLFRNGNPAIRGTCLDCSKFIQWIPFSESFLIKTLLKEQYLEHHELSTDEREEYEQKIYKENT